uniref:Uncharacterized protein n=1 Tax=Anguilla anguilla TaxID=7936 RepID=A0A0E9PDW5_ANGAN
MPTRSGERTDTHARVGMKTATRLSPKHQKISRVSWEEVPKTLT